MFQVSRYADVYASTVLNLIYYPFSYMFRAPSMLMPHESTVTHEQVLHVKDAPVSTISRACSVQQDIATPRPDKVGPFLLLFIKSLLAGVFLFLLVMDLKLEAYIA